MRSAIAFFSNRMRTRTRLVKPMRRAHARRDVRRGMPLVRAAPTPGRLSRRPHAPRRSRPAPTMPRELTPLRVH
jgi:hypothetical protein